MAEAKSTHECEFDIDGASTCGGNFQCDTCARWFGWCLLSSEDGETCNECAMNESLESRARQYAAALGDAPLANLVLDLIDEIATLNGRVHELEEEGVILRERGHDLKRQLDGALSIYSASVAALEPAAKPYVVDAEMALRDTGILTLTSKGFTVRKCSECGTLIGEVPGKPGGAAVTVNACQTDPGTDEDWAALADIVRASAKRLQPCTCGAAARGSILHDDGCPADRRPPLPAERHCEACGGLMWSKGNTCANCKDWLLDDE